MYFSTCRILGGSGCYYEINCAHHVNSLHFAFYLLTNSIRKANYVNLLKCDYIVFKILEISCNIYKNTCIFIIDNHVQCKTKLNQGCLSMCK